MLSLDIDEEIAVNTWHEDLDQSQNNTTRMGWWKRVATSC